MKPEKSLQKVTDSEKKIADILLLKKIEPEDIKHLNKDELSKFTKALHQKLTNLKGTDRDEFFIKIEEIVTENTRNQLWENNHNQIIWAISTLIQDKGRMPSKTEIGIKTELSRQTVHKHFKEYASHPQYLGQIEQFRFMTSKVLARVFTFAVNGNVAAAKLYLNMMGAMKNQNISNNTLIQNQNNYIQINETILSQEAIKHLNPEQLNTIEHILKTALPHAQVIKRID